MFLVSPYQPMPTAATEAQKILSCNPSAQFQSVSLQSCNSTSWSKEGSVLTSLGLCSRVHDFLNMIVDTPGFCVPTKQDFQRGSTISSLYSREGLVDMESSS